MRYVGRHRGPRPLLLRRPVVGGAVVLVLLAGPAYAIASGINNPIKRPATTADSAKVSTSSPSASASTAIPIDDGELASDATPGTSPSSVPAPVRTTAGGSGGGTNHNGGGSHTTSPGVTTTTPKTTSPKPTTTKPKPTTTTKPSPTATKPPPTSPPPTTPPPTTPPPPAT